jgi:hypothetical protein
MFHSVHGVRVVGQAQVSSVFVCCITAVIDRVAPGCCLLRPLSVPIVTLVFLSC